MGKTSNTGIGLALGGGAARGIAHIGVIKVLQEEQIPVRAVAGTSIGSIMGALYCSGMGWEQMWEVASEITWGELVQPTISGMGLVKTDKLERYIEKLLQEVTFQELTIPLQVVAFDIVRARQHILNTGSVARAVRASASIPGVFEPILEETRMLVDGGVSDNLPVRVLTEDAAMPTVAVDLNPWSESESTPQNLVGITFRAFMVLMWNTSQEGRSAADCVIQPDIGHIAYHELDKREELLEAGEKAARNALDEIRNLL